MTRTSLPQPHEQRKVEELLVKLSKMKPVFAKPAPIVLGNPTIRAACTANSQVFSRHKNSRSNRVQISRWPFGAWRKTLHPDESMGYCGQSRWCRKTPEQKAFSYNKRTMDRAMGPF